MATATGGEVQVESEDGVPVVLRVKRKRTEDPAESLGVSCIQIIRFSLLYKCLSVYHVMIHVCMCERTCTCM